MNVHVLYTDIRVAVCLCVRACDRGIQPQHQQVCVCVCVCVCVRVRMNACIGFACVRLE